MKILVINGPNLSQLEKRDKSHYGGSSLKKIEEYVLQRKKKSTQVDFFQSDIEGEIIQKIHGAIDVYDAIVINPAGYSHTSVAIYDALLLFKKSIVEVHLSNVYKREEFRHRMLTAKAAEVIIGGAGAEGYSMAIEYIEKRTTSEVSDN